MNHTPHAHDAGLLQDLEQLMQQQRNRRGALRWLGLAGTASLGGLSACGGGGDAGTSVFTNSTTSTQTATSASGTTCAVIPEETQGPYPGDGSNTANGSIANALALSGIVRSDIRSSVATASGTAAGTRLTLTITLQNVNNSCALLDGFAIYLWHCDAQGRYSMYSSGVTAENYLRGVQATDSNGQCTFTTIVPGCYDGRWPHMHFEVYRSTNTATSFSNKLKTSQFAIPQSVASSVYSSNSTYSGSSTNLAKVSLASDGIFSDGYSLQMLTATSDGNGGYVATGTVGISV